MIEYIQIILIIIILSIPAILILISVKNLYKKAEIKEVLAALSLSFLLYFPVTFIVILILLPEKDTGYRIDPVTGNYIVDKTPIWNPSTGLETDYKIFFGYIIFSLLLLWFADRGFMKIFKFLGKADLNLVKIK